MSERVKILFYCLWIAHPVLLTALAIVMLRRGQHRAYKYFFVYVVAQILLFGPILAIYFYWDAAFFYAASFDTLVSVALGFMVIWAAFLDLLPPFHASRNLGIVVLKWALLVTLLVAGVIAISNRPSDTAWGHAILTAWICLRSVQVASVVFLLIFARYMGVSWRQHSFGIALGFAIFSVVELVLLASWDGYHLSTVLAGLINVGAYSFSLLIWLGYALAKRPETKSTLLQPQRWEQRVSDIQYPVPVDSLIPTFEGMVDRALSRAQTTPSPAIYRELNLLETELKDNVKALKFTSKQILRRLARLGVLNRNPQSRGENSGDR
jgi:hypothetical protein